MNENDRIDRRDARRERRSDEIDRIEAIDRLADRLLDQAKYDDTPATEVWDIAAEIIDNRKTFPGTVEEALAVQAAAEAS